MYNQPLRTVVIEDERLARIELSRTLAGVPEIELVGGADSVSAARVLLREQQPELAFIDVQLGDGTGFDLLADCPRGMQAIVVSAYDAYAVRAFEASVIDYLLKPVQCERLRAAIEKVGRFNEPSGGDDRAVEPLAYEDHVFLSFAEDSSMFLPVSSICAVVADGDRTHVQTCDGSLHVVPRTLKHWEARLPGQAFARIHRSTIVNLRNVTRVDSWFNRRFRVFVDGLPRPLMMSRRYAHVLRKRFD